MFVVATSNRIELLPPELLRKGRFDEIFFIDLPALTERRDIFRIHVEKRRRDPAAFDLDLLARRAEGFSGAEIEQAVISALYDAFAEGRELEARHLERAVSDSLPLSTTMREEIANLRDWARTRTRAASIAAPEPVPPPLPRAG